MKKVIMVLMLSVASLFAGAFVGVDAGYGKVDSTVKGLSASTPYSYGSDTYTKSLTLKAGIAEKEYRILGYVSIDKFNDTVAAANEGMAKVAGIEFDLLFDKIVVGANIGAGVKSYDGKSDKLVEMGAKLGVLLEQSEDINAEFGIQYKRQHYKDTTGVIPVVPATDTTPYIPEIPTDTRDIQDNIIMVYVGIGFNL